MARHYTNCDDWGYDKHPDRATKLVKRCQILSALIIHRAASLVKRGFGFDTRRSHKFMFHGFTPGSCTCLLGNYRGNSDCIPLKKCWVRAGADELTGAAPYSVDMWMRHVETFGKALLLEHRELLKQRPPVPDEYVMAAYVKSLAKVLTLFLTIHPYMDGNGHTARALTLLMMVRGGFVPITWDVDTAPDYGQGLYRHRRGEPIQLEQIIWSAIIGVPASN